MSTQVQFRRGNTAQLSTFTGAVAEVTVNTDYNSIRVHDGITAGGWSLAENLANGNAGDLPYQSSSSSTSFLPIGSYAQVLISNGSTPAWSDLAAISSNTATNASNIYVNQTSEVTGAGGTFYLALSELYDDYGPISAYSSLTWNDTTQILSAPNATISGNTNSTGSTTGALIVTGGVGIGLDLNVGGNITAQGNIIANGNIVLGNSTGSDTLQIGSEIVSDLIPKTAGVYNIGSQTNYWNTLWANQLNLFSTANSTSTTTGALITAGGVGIGQDLWVGGTIYGVATTATTVNNTGAVNNNANYYVQFVAQNSSTPQTPNTTAALYFNPSNGHLSATEFLGSGAGLTSIPNSALDHSSITVSAGNGIFVSGSPVSLGGTVTVVNNGVLSFSGGLTGLTPSSATTGTVTLGGTLGTGYGGTNATSIGSAGSIAYSNGTAYAFNSTSTVGNILVSGGQGAPVFQNTLTLTSLTDSNSPTTGAFQVAGGAGIGKNLTVAGVTSITNTTNSSNTSSGALIVTGGASVGGDLYVGGVINAVIVGSITTATNIYGGVAGEIVYQISPGITGFSNVGNVGDVFVSGGTGAPQFQNTLTLASTVNASTVTSGAFQVAGGVGIAKDLYVGGTVYQHGYSVLDTNNIPNYAVTTLTAGTDTAVSQTQGAVTLWNVSTLQSVTNRGSTTNNPIVITNTGTSGSTITGALTVAGGAGIGGNLNVGGNLAIGGNTLFNGNVTFNGTATYVYSNQNYYTENLIVLHATTSTNANALWTYDDGKDVGIIGDYYDNVNSTGTQFFMGWRHGTASFEFFVNGYQNNSGNFVGSYGDITAGNFYSQSTTDSSNTTSGAIQTLGGAGIGGHLYVGNDINALGNVVLNGTAIVENTAGTSVNTSPVTVDSFPIANYRSAKYVVSVSNSGNSQYQTSEIILIHDGVTPHISYNSVFTGASPIMTFTTAITGTNVLLQGTGVSSGNTVKVQKIYI